MRSILCWGGLALLGLLCGTPVLAQVGNLSDEDLQRMAADGVPIVDIRRPAEWEQTGVIPGSHLLTFFDKRGNYDLDTWLRHLGRIAGEDAPFILVCRTGNRTGQVATFLHDKLGYPQVYHLEKGITAWIKSGHPVTKPTP